MPPVDIAPMMNHPAWGKTLSPAQRKQALELWQDTGSSDSDRIEMLKIMDQWQSAPVAQAPAPPQQAQAAQVPAEEPITPERRFLDLPSVQALPLEARTQLFQDFYGRSAERKEEFLRSKEPSRPQTPAVPAPAPGASQGSSERRLSMGDPREAASETSVHEMRLGLKWHGQTFSGCKGSSVYGRNLGTSARCSDVLPRQEDPHGSARCRDEYRGRRAGAPGAAAVCPGTVPARSRRTKRRRASSSGCCPLDWRR